MHTILKINAALFAQLFSQAERLDQPNWDRMLAAIVVLRDEESTSDDRSAAEDTLVELLMYDS